MRTGRTIVAAIALFAIATTVRAEPDDAYRLALNNFGHETVMCAAYYTMLARLMNTRTDGEQGAKRAIEVATTLIERAFMIATVIGQKSETVGARYQVSVKSMTEEIGGDAVNASILFVRNGDPCKAAAENPIPGMQYWIQKAEAEAGK